LVLKVVENPLHQPFFEVGPGMLSRLNNHVAERRLAQVTQQKLWITLVFEQPSERSVLQATRQEIRAERNHDPKSGINMVRKVRQQAKVILGLVSAHVRALSWFAALCEDLFKLIDHEQHVFVVAWKETSEERAQSIVVLMKVANIFSNTTGTLVASNIGDCRGGQLLAE
jgi:hypothetical protein